MKLETKNYYKSSMNTCWCIIQMLQHQVLSVHRWVTDGSKEPWYSWSEVNVNYTMLYRHFYLTSILSCDVAITLSQCCTWHCIQVWHNVVIWQSVNQYLGVHRFTSRQWNINIVATLGQCCCICWDATLNVYLSDGKVNLECHKMSKEQKIQENE